MDSVVIPSVIFFVLAFFSILLPALPVQSTILLIAIGFAVLLAGQKRILANQKELAKKVDTLTEAVQI